MYNHHHAEMLLEAIKLMDRPSITSLLEDAIESEKINLNTNIILRNASECIRIKHRIADAKLLLIALRGNLSS
jgi:hypothetical protein